jgi:hypothetical protein
MLNRSTSDLSSTPGNSNQPASQTKPTAIPKTGQPSTPNHPLKSLIRKILLAKAALEPKQSKRKRSHR